MVTAERSYLVSPVVHSMCKVSWQLLNGIWLIAWEIETQFLCCLLALVLCTRMRLFLLLMIYFDRIGFFISRGDVRDFLRVRDASALSAAKRCWSWRAKRWTALTYFSLKVLSCFPFPPKRNGNSFGGFWLIYVMQFSHPLKALIPLDWSRRFRTASLLFIDCALEFVNLYLHPISARGN